MDRRNSPHFDTHNGHLISQPRRLNGMNNIIENMTTTEIRLIIDQVGTLTQSNVPVVYTNWGTRGIGNSRNIIPNYEQPITQVLTPTCSLGPSGCKRGHWMNLSLILLEAGYTAVIADAIRHMHLPHTYTRTNIIFLHPYIEDFLKQPT